MNTKVVSKAENIATSRPAFLVYGTGLGALLTALLMRGCLLTPSAAQSGEKAQADAKQTVSAVELIIDRDMPEADSETDPAGQNNDLANPAVSSRANGASRGGASDNETPALIAPQKPAEAPKPRPAPPPQTPLERQKTIFNSNYTGKYRDTLIAISKLNNSSAMREQAAKLLAQARQLNADLNTIDSDAEKIDLIISLEKNILDFITGSEEQDDE